MSDEKKGPDYIAYSVRDRGPDKDAAWNRVGAAWAHRDGKGYDVQFDAVPVNGRMALREQQRQEYQETRGQSQQQQTQDRSR